jgi:ATP/maltotriose-dependent transcriptional regulator MalT
VLRQAGNAFRAHQTSAEDDLKWLGLAISTASATWDHEIWHALASHQVQLARSAGALTRLTPAINSLATLLVFEGDLEGAGVLLAEAEAVRKVTGSHFLPYGATRLAAVRGREPDASALIEATIKDATASGSGHVVRFALSASATLYNGLARYPEALAAAQESDAHAADWSGEAYIHELIEAAVRLGQRAVACEALDRLSEITHAIGDDWPLGVEARCRAMVSGSTKAEDLYRESIDRLGRTPMRVDLARAHLLFGEWLRRENRRIDARQHLRTAYEEFVTMGADAFADRASRELAATGETVRRRTVDTRDDLTAQEAQIARLAADGRTNPEIGAELFISARTVEWHLRKVYPKLGITSRRDLRRALPERRRLA